MAYQFKFHMDDEGHWISFDGRSSTKAGYRSPAVLQIGDRTFIGLSAYWEGTLAHETVLEVTAMETVKVPYGE